MKSKYVSFMALAAAIYSSNIAAQMGKSADGKYMATVQNTSEIDDILQTVNKLDKNGKALIHVAAENNELQVVEYLCNKPEVDLNLRDSNGRTAAHYAALTGHDECLKLLAVKKANLNLHDNWHYTRIVVSKRHTTAKVWRYTYRWEWTKCSENTGCTPLHLAALHKKFAAVKILLQYGADATIAYGNNNWWTPYNLFKAYHDPVTNSGYNPQPPRDRLFWECDWLLGEAEKNTRAYKRELALFQEAASKRTAALKQKLQEVLSTKIAPDLQRIIFEYAQPTPNDLEALSTATRAGNSIKMFLGFAPALE